MPLEPIFDCNVYLVKCFVMVCFFYMYVNGCQTVKDYSVEDKKLKSLLYLNFFKVCDAVFWSLCSMLSCVLYKL